MTNSKLAWAVLSVALAATGCGDSDNGSSGGTGGTFAGGTGGTVAGGTGGTVAGGTGGTAAAGTGGTGTAGTAAVDPCVTEYMATGESNMVCAQCVCDKCQAQLDAMYKHPDPTVQMQARAIINCSRDNCVSGSESYCGVDVALADCAAEGGAMGPCIAELDATYEGTGLAALAAASADETTVVGLTRLFGECTAGNPMPTDGRDPIIGMCETECMRTCN